jgi:lipopolysaccharide assembly outer membrane protein LptD (OstA)
MRQLYKFTPIDLLKGILSALIFCTMTWKTTAQQIDSKKINNSLTPVADTIKPFLFKDSLNKKTITTNDTLLKPGIDSTGQFVKTDTFTLKISKDTLDAPLHYKASDSAVVMIQDKKIILYGKTKTEYKDITLEAPKVEVDQATQIVTAVNRKDSAGAVIETAHFKGDGSEFTSDTIRYNFKTQIGQTKNTYTEQDGVLIIGEVAKKVSADVTFVKKARFTTCMLDEPHFDFVTGKMKVVNNKVAVAGPTQLEFEGVPVPVPLPFGFFR